MSRSPTYNMKIVSYEYFGEARHQSSNIETASRFNNVRELIESNEVIWPLREGVETIVRRTHADDRVDSVHHWSSISPAGEFRQLSLDTYATDDTFEIAMLAAGCGLRASDYAQKGENAFAIIRPPGHHATRDFCNGFCVFNNMGIAIEHLARRDSGNKVLVVDVDVHMGDGTRSIIKSSDYRDRLALLDIYQEGIYPFKEAENEGNIRQSELRYETPDDVWKNHFEREFYDMLASFRPNIIGLSLGFDTAELDLNAVGGGVGFCLTERSYEFLRKLLDQTNIPYFGLLEGGYRPESIKLGLDTFLGIKPYREAYH